MEKVEDPRYIYPGDDRKVVPVVTVGAKNKRKTLILVRHAQSEENVKVSGHSDGTISS